MAKLNISFCGIECENPFIVGSAITSDNYDMCARALKAGWGGIAFKTIGVEPVQDTSPRFGVPRSELGAAWSGFRNLEMISEYPLERNLEHLARLKKDFPGKLIIASIMGESSEEWKRLAREVTRAGADIVECNFSCPQMTKSSFGSDVGVNYELVEKFVAATVSATHLPVIAKMTPNITRIEPPATSALIAGAAGITAINTIKSITELDLDSYAADPSIGAYSSISGYSGRAIKPIALRFIHDIAKIPGKFSISGVGGIYTWEDALEFILLGASTVQIVTAVMEYGYRIIDDLTSGLSYYMGKHGIEDLASLVGKGLSSIVPASQLDRHTRRIPQIDKVECVGCGRCFISCSDAGHQAIEWQAKTREPLIGDNCVGCHLCTKVCPVGAISFHGEMI